MSLSKMVFIYKGVLSECDIKRFLILSPLQVKVKLLFGNELKTYKIQVGLYFIGKNVS